MTGIPLYRVKDYDKYFEINRSRKLKQLWWVAIPNKHDGDGYTDLITRSNGISLFGTWNLIVQVASKVPQPGRGTLVKSDGNPHDSASLSRKTRAPKEVFEEAFPILLEIGWLEVVRYCEIGSSLQIAQGAELEGHHGAVQTEQTGQDNTEQNREDDDGSGLDGEGRTAQKIAYFASSGISAALMREGNGPALESKIVTYPLDQIERCWEYAQDEHKHGRLIKPPLALFQALLKRGFVGPPTKAEIDAMEAEQEQERIKAEEEGRRIRKELCEKEKKKFRKSQEGGE